ncbi:MAG: hypothetical protein V2A73_05280, partial [Pseudomonadota bacterium]
MTGRAALMGGALLVCALMACSCDPVAIVRGNVTVPLDVQNRFSSDSRGRLYVFARYSKNEASWFGATAIAVLCGPQQSQTPTELVVPFEINRVGCVSEMIVEATVDPLPVDITPTPPCGIG